jgi:hypothetical protein
MPWQRLQGLTTDIDYQVEECLQSLLQIVATSSGGARSNHRIGAD